MDRKIKKYEKAILSILNEYAKIKYANVVGGNQLIADTKNQTPNPKPQTPNPKPQTPFGIWHALFSSFDSF